MARCLICKSVWGDDPFDPFWVCDLCLATKPVEVSEAWDKLYKKAADIWFDTKYKSQRSDDHQFITTTGSIAWTWVILRANDKHMEPLHTPIWFTEKKRICRMASMAGPFPYSHSRLVQALMNKDYVNHAGMYEIYDETGFLVTPGNVGKYALTVEEATELIHWGKIKYVMQWVNPRKKPRKYFFPKFQSLVTSFLGGEAGLTLIHNLVMNNVIVWNEEYEVYTTYHFDPNNPPEFRYQEQHSEA